jgi:hypothetical protein
VTNPTLTPTVSVGSVAVHREPRRLGRTGGVWARGGGGNVPSSAASTRGHSSRGAIDSYTRSPGYTRDLAATQRIWSQPATAGTAGAYIFLLYLCLPILLDVRPASGVLARSALDGERERAFLMNLTGCTDDEHWRGGIRNPRVRRQADLLGRHHARFGGMRPGYLDFIGVATTLAPLEVRTEQRTPVQGRCRRNYWRYMSRATSLLSADIGDEASARDRCRSFVDAYAAPSGEGSRLYASLREHHPQYVAQAAPILPGRARELVDELAGSLAC